MGSHLGWHFAVGCPLRGGREENLLKKHQKQLRKKKNFYLKMLLKGTVQGKLRWVKSGIN
jgi:hypothetical protein